MSERASEELVMCAMMTNMTMMVTDNLGDDPATSFPTAR